jgi:anti-anti-sigma factor
MGRESGRARPVSGADEAYESGAETRVDIDGDRTVIVSGPVDLVAGPALRSALEEAVRPERPLVVDLSGVTFIDCAGLSVLLGAGRDGDGTDRAPSEVVLHRPSLAVGRLLLLADVDGFVRVRWGTRQVQGHQGDDHEADR